MLSTSIIAVLSTILLVNAQASPQIEVESIDAQFDNAYLVPDLLATFDPIAYLTVDFNGNAVVAGTPLTTNDTQTQPTVTITAANSTATLGDLFTLAMVDPGAIGKLSTPGPTRHWLVNGVTIGANGELTIPPSASAITPYGAPFPDAADAPHRYAILLWSQPTTFAPTGDLATPGQPITQFDLNAYVTSSGLGPVVAGWYFTCTRGTAVAPTSTSAVNTATLPGASGASGATSGTGSHTGTASSTATSSTRTGAALSSFSVTPLTVFGSIAAAFFGIVVA